MASPPHPSRRVRAASLALLAALALGCGNKSEGPDGGAPGPSASASSGALASATGGPPAAPLPPATRVGSALARTPRGDALVLADEDHRALRVVPLPLDAAKPRSETALPGAPAQVVALSERVLVTLRDPGLLLVMKPEGAGLVEAARVAVAADAWGLAVTPDDKTALVTSAWTHTVTAVDLGTMAVKWTASVPREPRGVVITADGATAYVSHLVGPALTRVDLATGATRAVELPAAPLRTPAGKALPASLGFALALDGERLFAARHALGALGTRSWFGASTVDVLLLAGETPLAPRRPGRAPFLRADKETRAEDLTLPGGPLGSFTQPRALALRGATRSLLVVSEGLDAVVELDATALDPTNAVMRSYPVGGAVDPYLGIATTCGAPQAISLSVDEQTAYLLCRSTYDVAALALDPHSGAAFAAPPPSVVRFAEDTLSAGAAKGRRLFYNATDPLTSGGLACSGCHPEGRDDGHTWHEARINTEDGTRTNFVGAKENLPEEEHARGVARRTPLLAGRIASGPYGWHGESPDLVSRLVNGFGLHRWGAVPPHAPQNLEARAGFLAEFARVGLVLPPREERPLTAVEERGREVFASEATHCAKCHLPSADYTDRVAYPLPALPSRPDFDDEPDALFKTPSLRFLSERAPYYHDGSAPTLEALIANNNNRMGQTNHLSAEERAALVAFLKTL